MCITRAALIDAAEFSAFLMLGLFCFALVVVFVLSDTVRFYNNPLGERLLEIVLLFVVAVASFWLAGNNWDRGRFNEAGL
jgi:ABC-type dipeptide/oligopeptide/nickel transport system permease component